MLLTALLANPPSNMLCRSILLNGRAPRCCIVDGHRRPVQSSIAADTGRTNRAQLGAAKRTSTSIAATPKPLSP